MKIKEKIFVISLILISFLLLFNIKVYAGTQEWNALDYDVTVNPDGSMDVVETWDITITDTNTVFKDFDIDNTKYSGITDVIVTNVYNGEELMLEQIFEEQYHVDPDCYYALPINGNSMFEIAWNVGLENRTARRTYKVYYTIQDAIKIYNDCTELYWMFLDKSNEIPGKNVTGTIKLPQSVSDIEKLRVWAHGDLSGNIERTSEDTISFSIGTLNSGSRLEVRIITEENVYEDCTNIIYENKLEEILAEEKKWANQANLARDALKVGFYAIIAVNIVGIFIVILKINKTIEEGKLLEEQYAYPEYDIKYFREIPDEQNATPARASLLNNFSYSLTGMSVDNLSEVFAGTMLDFCLKGIIEFEPVDEKNVRIILKENTSIPNLPADEAIVYDILKSAMGNNTSITTKEFSKYSKNNYEEVYKNLNRISKEVVIGEIRQGNIDRERKSIVDKILRGQGISLVAGLFLLFAFIVIASVFPLILLLIPLFIAMIVLMIYKGNNANKISILSEKGYRESKQWAGLENYMRDYSLLKEKTVPDIVLWEKFLVYATTFGISKQVIKQLKVVHPEMFEMDETSNAYVGRYAYWNIVCNNRYGMNYFDTIDKSLNNVCKSAVSAYNSAHSSSSGGGGGFSGGGGGRRRRWRLRRTLK